MKSKLLQIADTLRSSYWFLPSVMAFGAIVLAFVMLAVDTLFGSAWMAKVPWLYSARPDGARQLLSSIGGSMITVAGTVFSVTIAAVVYASGQYGPRLLTNFMEDRGNQVTLGTFIATFVYSLMILRTIQSPGENGNGVGFVPNDALLVAVVLALCSIAVLIFFIHHVPSRIHINSVIEQVGSRLLKEIENRFPSFIGEPKDRDDSDAVPSAFRDDGASGSTTAIEAHDTGYIVLIDDEALMDIARKHDLVLRLQYQPGNFVHRGRALVEAAPADRCDKRVCRGIRDAFAVAERRSALQDLGFLFDELVEIAARALSPGVNDPFTAISCLDWLGAAVSNLAGRDMPSHLRKDDDGALRVIAHPEDFATFIERAFGALIQYCAADMNASLRFLGALGEVALDCDVRSRVALLQQQADRLEALAETALAGINLARVRERANELRRALAEPDYRRRLRDDATWLGGTA